MLDLKSFHAVLICAAIVLLSGLGMWGMLNDYKWLGAISLVVAAVLVVYGAYFAGRTQRT